MNQRSPGDALVEKPTLGQIILRSAWKSFLVGAALSLLYFGVMYAIALNDADPYVGVILVQSGRVLALTWAPVFAFLLIASSRVWSDRAFTAAGFLATFAGLAILAVFFFQLAEDVHLWLHFTPLLIEKENREHQKTLDAANNLKGTTQAALHEKKKQREELLKSAKNADEKEALRKRFDADVIVLELILKRAEQTSTIAERSLRSDTSPGGIFAHFLTGSTEKHAQDSGIGPALWGSVWLGLITILFAVPIGVGAALYLEEYRQEGWIARVIQVNINNLAGVPSVVYGILGGFVFVYFFRKVNAVYPNVDPFNLLGGGLTLGLLTLPMIIVSAQEAIRAVPSSLRHGAYALGATKWQTIWTIVLPMARPGILTGTILSLSRAIGEAAPLVLFGAQQTMDRSPTLFSKFTALPLQIYQWCSVVGITVDGYADAIEIWKFNAAVASTVLLVVLLGLNGIAIFLRNRAQQKSQY